MRLVYHKIQNRSPNQYFFWLLQYCLSDVALNILHSPTPPPKPYSQSFRKMALRHKWGKELVRVIDFHKPVFCPKNSLPLACIHWAQNTTFYSILILIGLKNHAMRQRTRNTIRRTYFKIPAFTTTTAYPSYQYSKCPLIAKKPFANAIHQTKTGTFGIMYGTHILSFAVEPIKGMAQKLRALTLFALRLVIMYKDFKMSE